jgi:hypothetical protein
MEARNKGVWIIAGALAIAVASGCSESAQHSGSSTATNTSTQPSTLAETPTTTTQNALPGVPLYRQFEAERSVGPNGKPINATLAGTNYPDATGMWVGCGGQPATTTYRLTGGFSRLHAIAGLEPNTPDGLKTHATLTADGRVLQEFTIEKTQTQPIDVDLTGVDTFVVAAIAVNPSLCGSSSTPYGALGAALLTPAG